LKRALTLIELIFTIVIIAFVFTVIPKIIYVSNKTLEFSQKEDALFNLMAKLADISYKEYDEKNTEYDDILLVNDPPKYVLDCDQANGYRVGGFVGGRNCKNAIFESDITADSDEPPYDDVDDYNGTEETTTKYGRVEYNLSIEAGYTDEWNASSYDYSNQLLNFAFSKTSDNTHTNIKRIHVQVLYNGESVASASYYSANIGHTKIESVQW